MATVTPKTKLPIILKSPRVTEKATKVASGKKPAYVFNVAVGANKPAIIAAIKTAYKVTPVKVNVVNSLGKQVSVRGKMGKRPDNKKAYVYLKAGDKIEIT